jgi:hypothetical protein
MKSPHEQRLHKILAKLSLHSSYQWLLSDAHLTQLIVLLSIFASSYGLDMLEAHLNLADSL